jgi:hypothetical protein
MNDEFANARSLKAGRCMAVSCFLLLCCTACSKEPPPTLSGGQTVSHWIDALRSPDPNVRKEGVFKLGNVGAADPAVEKALVSALDDADARVRMAAITALLKTDSAVNDAAAKLAELKSRDPDPKVRAAASSALAHVPATP